MRKVLVALGFVAIGLLASCGGSHQVVYNRLVPKDKEAADLQRAYNDGLLTPEEYAQQKSKLGL